MTAVVLAFWAGVLVVALWPDRSERAELARWMRERVATLAVARDNGRHYDRHPSQSLPRSAHGIGEVCPSARRACKLHDFEGIAPRDGIARVTPEGLPNVWADLEHPSEEV